MKTDNELIAEFMGLKSFEDSRYGTLWPSPLKAKTPANCFGLCYHESWDWLMPVVEKIGTMSMGFHVNINTFDGCGIYDDQYRSTGQGKSISSGINGNLIQVTYKAVVEFIKWYNEQKSLAS